MERDAYTVAVVRDWRVPERDFRMGLDALLDDSRVTVRFLRAQDGPDGPVRAEELAGVDAVVSLVDEVTAPSLAEADDLAIVAKYGAGFDNVDLAACTERGIPVTNAPQAPTDSVAEATLGMVIACAHGFKRYDAMVRESGFDGPVLENMGTELAGKTLGVIGFGRIGHRLTELVEPLGMTVLVHDPYLAEERAAEAGVERVGLDELVETADVVSLHCPLTDETAGMLTEDHFRRMRESAFLVNTTRGGIYADADLARAVREGWIAGAAVDVYEDESDVSDNPLLAIPDVLATPHVAGLTEEALTEYGLLCAEAIRATMTGEVPPNVLNPDALDVPVPPEKRSPSFRE